RAGQSRLDGGLRLLPQLHQETSGAHRRRGAKAMIRQTAMRTAILLAAALGLAGCSGDPSEADMLAAVNGNAQFQQTMAFLASDMRGRVSQATLNDLKSRGLIEKSAC